MELRLSGESDRLSVRPSSIQSHLFSSKTKNSVTIESSAIISMMVAVALILLVTGEAQAQTVSPPAVTILQNKGQLAAGFIFITPDGSAPPDTARPFGLGPEIIDNQGRPVWFNPETGTGVKNRDLRVQSYRGQPVLTWVREAAATAQTPATTVGYLLDSTYKIVATVKAGNGLTAESHEFQLTRQNTALLSIYNSIAADLSAVGGAANGRVIEGVVQEIDVATGKVLLEWHSLPDVPLTDSYQLAPPASTPNVDYDYFHLNSVSVDTDGNLLVSARHTSTIYKINRTTGALMWKMGGKGGNFTLGAGASFAWQHHAIAVDANTICLFDNESNGTPILPYSRVIWVRRDESTMTATLVRSLQHPDALSSGFTGSAQQLDNGDTFVSWGASGRFSEFDSTGRLLFDAAEPPGLRTYRAYRFRWVGAPTTIPTATAEQNSDGTMIVHAIWNGATEVAHWQVLGGNAPDELRPITTAPWNGLDTAILVPNQLAYVQIVALNAAGLNIGSSPNFEVLASRIVASGSAVTLTVPGSETAPNLLYQWYRNGTAIPGATSPTLMIANATFADAGTYSRAATGSISTATINVCRLTVSSKTPTSRLSNFSILANVSRENQTITMGFTMGGANTSGFATMLVRASGPALAVFGATNGLADPALTVFRRTTLVAANDNWSSQANNGAAVAVASAAVGAFPFTDPNSLDSALVCTLAANAYSAQVTGNGAGSGLVLTELYDATPADNVTAPRLINLSARSQVGSGTNILIAGFVVQGSIAKRVLIRAVGPALRAFGVADALADPRLSLRAVIDDRDSLVAYKTAWSGDPLLSDVANAVGAFPLPEPASGDSSVLVTLPPGAYTVQVTSVSGGTGCALLEIYEVP